MALDLTGPDARWGLSMLQGVELAIEGINRQGGAGGYPLEMLLLDSSASRPDSLSQREAVTASYERFVADPSVIAVVGPQTSLRGGRWPPR